MFKMYLKTKLSEVTFWIGIAVILSTTFAPHFVTIFFGFLLVFTPDKKANQVVRDLKDKVEGSL